MNVSGLAATHTDGRNASASAALKYDLDCQLLSALDPGLSSPRHILFVETCHLIAFHASHSSDRQLWPELN